jgi:hypothetical protein
MNTKSLLAMAVAITPELAVAESAEDKLDRAFSDSPFASVSFLGNANLIAGALTDENDSPVASGGVGFVAETKHWTFVSVFTFGSAGTGDDSATTRDYVEFLQVPTSALGADLHVRWLTKLKESPIWLGASLGIRGSHQSFGFGESDSESINALGLDPSAALSVPLDVKKSMYFIAEAGLAARFWNRPAQAFVDALDMDSRDHAYFGFRGLAAMNIGSIHVGVELMRLWGGNLDELKEFAIIPYVGFRGGLSPATDPATRGLDGTHLPPPTPLM